MGVVDARRQLLYWEEASQFVVAVNCFVFERYVPPAAGGVPVPVRPKRWYGCWHTSSVALSVSGSCICLLRPCSLASSEPLFACCRTGKWEEWQLLHCSHLQSPFSPHPSCIRPKHRVVIHLIVPLCLPCLWQVPTEMEEVGMHRDVRRMETEQQQGLVITRK